MSSKLFQINFKVQARQLVLASATMTIVSSSVKVALLHLQGMCLIAYNKMPKAACHPPETQWKACSSDVTDKNLVNNHMCNVQFLRMTITSMSYKKKKRLLPDRMQDKH